MTLYEKLNEKIKLGLSPSAAAKEVLSENIEEITDNVLANNSLLKKPKKAICKD